MSTPALMKLTYRDKTNGVRLTGYADTLAYDEANDKKILRAIRFGGYPEEVEGMAAAIFGGAAFDVELSGSTIQMDALTRQYRRSVDHDGAYAVATLIVEDDNQQAQEGDKDEEASDAPSDPPPRTNYIFCTPGDKRELFDAVDQKTAAPLIPEFQDYVLQELVKRKILRPPPTHPRLAGTPKMRPAVTPAVPMAPQAAYMRRKRSWIYANTQPIPIYCWNTLSTSLRNTSS